MALYANWSFIKTVPLIIWLQPFLKPLQRNAKKTDKSIIIIYEQGFHSKINSIFSFSSL